MSSQSLIRVGHDYLEGLAPIDRTIIALAVHWHLDFPGSECYENQRSIIAAMNAGLVGPFNRQDEILGLIGQYIQRYPDMKPADMYANLAFDF